MALLDPNTLVGILHGKLGNLVVARMKDGRIVVRRPPVRKARCTEGERVGQRTDFSAEAIKVAHAPLHRCFLLGRPRPFQPGLDETSFSNV